MSSEIIIEGFEDFFQSVKKMEINADKERKGIRAALNVLKRYAEPNAPYRTGRTKKSLKVKIKRSGFGLEGVLYVDDWKAMFQEFRNSKQEGRHIGWFEKSVRSATDVALDALQKEAFK
ncbi:MAG: HK97-gp10 family putative phage morphogenesis protein [Filifactoraceae bacterium]